MPTQTADWLDCLVDGDGYRDASRLYEAPDGCAALLPLVSRTRMTGGSAVIESFPRSWGYGGLLAEGRMTTELASAVLDDLARLPALLVHVRPNPLQSAVWFAAAKGRTDVTVVPNRAHVLDLDGGFDEVWDTRFKGATRTAVRRARRHGITIDTDTTGRLIPEFYELLELSFDRWARRQHEPIGPARVRAHHRDPIRKFHTIAEHLGEHCQLSVARFEGHPVAATVVLRGGSNAYYTRGAIDHRQRMCSAANRLLHATAIEDACRSGCRRYHMGESGTSSGLAQFKEGFGAQPLDCAEYWIERVPFHRADVILRAAVKKAIGFRDA